MEKARAKDSRDGADTSLPEPIELAKLAAIMCPHAQPGIEMLRAILRAIEFYSEASRVVASRLHPRPLKEAKSKKLRYAAESQAAFSVMDEKWSQTLELDPAADTDEAREYLSTQGCNWNGVTVLRKIREICGKNAVGFLGNNKRPGKWARIGSSAVLQTELAVLNNLLAENRHDATTRAELDRRAQTVRQLLDESKRSRPAWQWLEGRVFALKGGKAIYEIPRFVLDVIAREAKAHERRRKREWAQKNRKKQA
jgi:hypothetical protein